MAYRSILRWYSASVCCHVVEKGDASRHYSITFPRTKDNNHAERAESRQPRGDEADRRTYLDCRWCIGCRAVCNSGPQRIQRNTVETSQSREPADRDEIKDGNLTEEPHEVGNAHGGKAVTQALTVEVNNILSK